MRKFTIKNRQKRKYTRKITQTSSFPRTRTLSAGLLPLFILAIALVTTLIMSQAKDQTLALHYSLSIPQPQLPDVGNAIQNIPNLLTSPIAFMVSVGIIVADFFQSIGVTIAYWFVQMMHVLDPRPLIAVIQHGLQLILQGTIHFANLLALGVMQAYVATIQGFVTIGNGIVNVATTVFHAITVGVIAMSLALFHAAVFIATIVLWLMKGFVSVVTNVCLFIGNQVMALCTAVANVIEIPFKILWKFWLIIKPFFDILGAHIGMTGSDLQNGFASWGKVSSLLPPPSK